MILEESRKIFFWSLDRIHKGEIRNAYRDIMTIDSYEADDPRIQAYQQNQFERLVKHVHATVPFYKSHIGAKLSDFPVIDKNIVKAYQKEFLSTEFNTKNLFKMRTSGSTGIPFICYQDRHKKKRVHAEIIYYSEKAGYKVGYPLIYLRSGARQAHKGIIRQLIQNQPQYSCKDLSDLGIENLLSKLRVSSKHTILLAYASTLGEICDYFLRNGTEIIQRISLGGIISSAEMLFDQTREILEDAFRCKCVSRYSNQEQGVIGQDYTENNVFLLNEADYIVEIFDMDKDVPAGEGEVGRIVVTDLFNYAMPLIRYDTGDIGAICTCMCEEKRKRAINSFGGRRIDMIYDCYNHKISPYFITNALYSFPGIRQFQFIQVDAAKYVLKVNADKTDQLSERLIVALREVLGAHAQISIEYVDGIPVLGSGKRKYLVNAIQSGEMHR